MRETGSKAQGRRRCHQRKKVIPSNTKFRMSGQNVPVDCQTRPKHPQSIPKPRSMAVSKAMLKRVSRMPAQTTAPRANQGESRLSPTQISKEGTKSARSAQAHHGTNWYLSISRANAAGSRIFRQPANTNNPPSRMRNPSDTHSSIRFRELDPVASALIG
jgi:hypothetical protein